MESKWCGPHDIDLYQSSTSGDWILQVYERVDLCGRNRRHGTYVDYMDHLEYVAYLANMNDLYQSVQAAIADPTYHPYVILGAGRRAIAIKVKIDGLKAP